MKPSARDVQRRLALIPYLQSKQGISVDEVAREFDVPARTIRKDVSQLMMTGVGRYGGDLIDIDFDAFESDDRIYISNADFMPRPLQLNAGEAAALIVALRALRDVAEPGREAPVEGALAKLEALVDSGATGVDVLVEPTNPAVVDPVNRALNEQRRLEIEHVSASRDAATTRQVDPYATFTRDGHVYLDAWCHLVQAPRFFRLDRIQRAEVLDVPVQPGSPRTATEFFAPGTDALEVELEVSPSARWVVEHYDAQIIDSNSDVWRVSLLASDEAWVRRLALRAGGAIRVVSPAAIRDEVTERARAALAAYDGITFATEES